MSDIYIQINTGGKTIQEYSRDISSAICEIQKLLYEHGISDLDEAQNYAFLLLTNLQQQVIEGPIGGYIEDSE